MSVGDPNAANRHGHVSWRHVRDVRTPIWNLSVKREHSVSAWALAIEYRSGAVAL